MRLQTDNTGLFEYSVDEINKRNDIEDFQQTNDVYAPVLRPECFDIKTRYELMFPEKGESIKYLRFRFR